MWQVPRCFHPTTRLTRNQSLSAAEPNGTGVGKTSTLTCSTDAPQATLSDVRTLTELAELIVLTRDHQLTGTSPCTWPDTRLFTQVTASRSQQCDHTTAHCEHLTM